MKRSRMIISTALLFILVFITLTPLSAAEYRTGANPASSSYMSGKYYEHFASIPLMGDGVTDTLAIALSQLGYQEGNSPEDFDGLTPTAGNHTEYNYNMGDFGIGYGGLEYHWCASFVSFCLYQSACHDYGDFFDCARYHENDTNYIWREISCQKWVQALRCAGRFENRNGYIPCSGDLIFFTRDGKHASHIGLVLYSEGGTVYTVEGNTSSTKALEINGGGVYTKKYPVASSYILGYGRLPYKSTDQNKIDYSGKAPTAGLYISSGVKYLYTDASATVRADINLPKYTLFHVSCVARGTGLSAILECEYMGKTYYIKNNTDRIYQLTHEEVIPETTAAAPETTSAPETTEAVTTAPATETTLPITTKIESIPPSPQGAAPTADVKSLQKSANYDPLPYVFFAAAIAVSVSVSSLCLYKSR